MEILDIEHDASSEPIEITLRYDGQIYYAKIIQHAEWILEESPYAEHEEAVDGESHPRWVCSHCGNEAGFECDPNGFAGWQERTTWCGHCGRLMNAKEGYANEKAGR